MKRIVSLAFVLSFLHSLFLPLTCLAQTDLETIAELKVKIKMLENEQANQGHKLSQKTSDVEHRIKRIEGKAGPGIGLFLSGVVCALWAQYTGRSAWLWFFFGAILAPLALISMLWKNSAELASGKLHYWFRRDRESISHRDLLASLK